MTPLEYIGQGFGVLAVILGFISYQMKEHKKLLFLQITTCAVFCIHYGLIGAAAGLALNMVGVVRNVVYAHRDKKIFSSPVYTYVFAALMAVAGAFSWQGWESILMISGLIINTFGMSFKDPQNIRKSILVSSPLVLLYDILVLSIGGAVYESIVIISSVIGIIKFKNR